MNYEEVIFRQFKARLRAHAAKLADELFYVGSACPGTCTICHSRESEYAGIWLASPEIALLHRRSDGRLLAGIAYFVCPECRDELGDAVPDLAEADIKANLERSRGLRETGEASKQAKERHHSRGRKCHGNHDSDRAHCEASNSTGGEK